MVKIQVAVSNEGWQSTVRAPDYLTGWADLESMPVLHNVEEAEQWMAENKTKDLEQYGLKFRIVEADEQAGNLAQLLSAEVDDQGNPRITFHLNEENRILGLIDEETLELLDADWDEAKTASTG